MASGQLLLKGRYVAKTVKIGIATGIACTVSGIGTYVLVKSRINESEEYIKTITDDFHKSNDDRIMKFAGFNRDKRFPSVPLLNNSEGAYTDYYKKHADVDYMLKLESEVLGLTEKDKYFAELFLAGIKSDWIENIDEKRMYHDRLNEARQKVWAKGKSYMGYHTKKDLQKIPKEDRLLFLYCKEMKSQILRAEQRIPMPLAVKYLPKPPSE